MPDDERRADRDADLVKSLNTQLRATASAFRQWLQDEATDLKIALDIVEHVDPGPKHTDVLERVNEILSGEISDAWIHFKERVAEMEDRVYDHPMDAYMYLDEGLWQMQRLCRHLLMARRYLQGLED